MVRDRQEFPTIRSARGLIGYCISCRSNRPIESAEREFFLNVDVGDIPVVVVFTQFDTLVDSHFNKMCKSLRSRNQSLDMDQIDKDSMNAAVADYDDNYRGQFESQFGRRLRVAIIRLNSSQQTSGVDSLIAQTKSLLLEDGLKLLWTAAQSHSADMKLKGLLRRFFRNDSWCEVLGGDQLLGATNCI
ncbi:uncharacterized protein J7T54_005477 [Emericellopsis cladophorae]|uniref:Uncharacterized protein n=1 Tax=Emericellopsis cladophorae TaxID=2686198 RepID=A0A9Q0B948_9HYPO|nr:uncharacterized protein J7T54_005477 [Emericellopsis cladophorae]KAI6777697.1 hypothetical protein J7T54_005477 [Emericellopsis cladophorae]